MPKRDLVAALVVIFQAGRLKIAKDLKQARTLRDELLNFKVKIDTRTAHDSYAAWREGQHDDLVLSAALAAWYADKAGAQRAYPRILREEEVSMDEQAKQEFAARYGLPVWAITQAETPDDPTERRKRLCEQHRAALRRAPARR